jgi:predicted lipoprotein with Yx(FWY)xxD motif
MRFDFTRIAAATAAGVAALTLAAACSSSSSPAAGAAAPATSASASAAAPATSTGAAATAGGIMTTAAPGLGTIVVDSTGRTLYRYDKDSNNPPTSNCSGGCLAAWPPVPATTTVTGISSSLIGSITGTDGSKQLTVAGWPVYYFAQDTAAGQFNGQGVGGTWWVVSPTGTEIKTSATAAATSSSSSGGGGY